MSDMRFYGVPDELKHTMLTNPRHLTMVPELYRLVANWGKWDKQKLSNIKVQQPFELFMCDAENLMMDKPLYQITLSSPGHNLVSTEDIKPNYLFFNRNALEVAFDYFTFVRPGGQRDFYKRGNT